MKRLGTMLLVLAALWLAISPVLAAVNPPVDEALAWLRTQQQADGGITSGFAEGSDLGATVETILAATAAAQDPAAWEPSPLPYLEALAADAEDATAMSRLLVAAVALRQDPRDFGGVDLIAALLAVQDSATAQFGDSLYAHAYALLALHNAGVALPEDAVQLLVDQQQDAGGWAMFGGFGADTADTNTTALAVQALVAAGESDVAQAALPYFRAMQNEDGGFPWQKPSEYGTDTDANSTAVVVQALTALGEALDDWGAEEGTPLEALLALWDEDTGAYHWQAAMPGANVLATAQAVQALMGANLVELPVAGEIMVIMAEPPAEEPAPVTMPEAGGPFVGGLLVLAGAALIGGGLALRRWL